MEDTLRVSAKDIISTFASLNPCFNGRYSQSIPSGIDMEAVESLNPCFNGRYSQS